MRKLTDGERDILNEQNRDACDDAGQSRDEADAELVTEPCPGCGVSYTHTADECDPCCSAKCANTFHAARQAEVNAALTAWWGRERQQMRKFTCAECGQAYTDYPTSDGTCSQSCARAQTARLYASGEDDKDVPF